MPLHRATKFKAKLEDDAKRRRRIAPPSCFASKQRAAEWQAAYDRARLHGGGRWQRAVDLCRYARQLSERKGFKDYERFLVWLEWRLVRHGFEKLEVKRLLFHALYETRELRRTLWRNGLLCEWCSERITAGQAGNSQWVEIDHRIPLSKGGSNAIGNLALLHRSCNRQKGNRLND